MKILYITMSYNPTANNLYNNLVDELLKNGHEITVVRSDSKCEETSYEEVSDKYYLLNVKTGNPFESNLVKKGINQISLERFFKKAIKEFLARETYDLILYATPPITLSGVISYCKKYYNAKTFLMLKDIFPQNAVDLGMFSKGSIIYKYFRFVEKKYYTISDYIGCMSQGNIDFVKRHNPTVNYDKLHVFYNSINVENCGKTTFNDDYTKFIFGGNLGKPQNIPYLLEIIKELDGYSKAKFQIIGSGTEQKRISEFIEKNNLSNLTYEEFLPSDEYEKRLETADIGLISLDSRFTIPNIPSKFQSYLKLKKPVLAITDDNTDLRDMIIDNDCGWWCSANNKDEIIESIKRICENKAEQIEKGENGHKYLLQEFDVVDNVRRIEKFMEEC